MGEPVRNFADNKELRERASLLVQSQIQEADGQDQDLRKEWQESEQLWRGVSISDVFPSDEIKHVPEPFNRVETIVPRIHSGLFGIGNWFSVAASDEDWMKSEDKVREVILWQCMQGDWRFYSDQEDGIRKMAIYGTVVFKNDWYTRDVKVAERKVTRTRVEVGNVYLGDKEKRADLELVDSTFAYPRGRPLNIRNVVMDRYCDNITECRYIGDQFVLTLDELERRGQEGKDGEPAYLNVEQYRADLEAEFVKKNPSAKAKRTMTQVRPYEMWTDMEIEGKVQPVAIVIGELLTENQVLRITLNTFPGAAVPYQVGRYIKRPGEMYGVGAIIPIRDTSAQLDELRTLHLRGIQLSISPPFIAQDDAQLPDRLLLYPGRVLSSPIRDGLKAVQIPVNPTAYQMENLFRNDIAQTSRAPDIWAGQSAGGRETAFEVGRKLQESGMSLGRIVRRYGTEVLKPMLRNFMALNHMHLTEHIRIRKLGAKAFGRREAFKDINPTDIQAQFDFEILDISEVALMGSTTREWVAFLQAVPQQIQGVLRWDRVLKDMLKSMGRDAPEDYVNIEPDAEDLLSAREEHQVLAAKHNPPVLSQHNHIAHIGQHTMFKAEPEYKKWSIQQKEMLETHISDHLSQIARQQEAALQQAAQVGLGGQPPGQQPNQPGRVPAPRPPATQSAALQQAAGQNQG